MSNFSRIVAGVGVLAAVVLAGVVLGWWGSKGSDSTIQPPAPESAGPSATENNNCAPRPKHATNAAAKIRARRNTPGTSGTATNLMSDWEDKIDGILGSELDDAVKAKQMLAMFPQLPE